MEQSHLVDLLNLGLKPIPMIWNAETKTASSHCIAHSTVTKDNYDITNFNAFIYNLKEANGIGIKLFAPFGCFDFDLKNTNDKEIFSKWLHAVKFLDDDILSKVCIETTRNGGYHVYVKYNKLTSKKSLAKEVNGEEVIALYTGGALSYCDPTPGYKMYHNEWQDLEELTDDQFDILVSSAVSFNLLPDNVSENKETLKVDYPIEY